VASRADLDPAVAAALARARAAWPELAVDDAAFAAAIAAAVADAADPGAAVAELAIEDLYLAQACATGAKAALDAFGRRCDPAVLAALRQLGLAADAVDDLLHEVRTKLFVGDGAPDRHLLGARGATQLGAHDRHARGRRSAPQATGRERR